VKEIRSCLVFTFLPFVALFFFTGCEDKKEQDHPIPVENTTTVFTQKDKDQQEDKKKTEINNTVSQENNISTDTVILSDIQQNQHTLTVDRDQTIIFHDIDQPIVLINFFATWCSPCRAEIPYLSDLQKKYEKKVFIAGILVNDTPDNNELKQFTDKNHAEYFISNSKQNDTFASKIVKELQLSENFPIPLTVIYKNGHYFTHYEGAVPVEMIDHDIQEAIKE
jgi:thiol-disulfide isomerase/thioredoxin